MYACAGHLVHVGAAGKQTHDHFGMLLFLARRCAIFAITCDVENRPQLDLEFKRFADQLLRTSEVFAGRNDRKWLFALEKNLIGMFGHAGLQRRAQRGMSTV